MNLPILSRFKSSGSPQTGLSPTITIRKVSQSGAITDVLVDQAMTESSDGLYLYNFASFNPLLNYVFTMDAGATSDQRYIESVWNGLQTLVDLIPRGGGGGSTISLTKKELKEITESLTKGLEDFFGQLEIEIPNVETKEIEALIKQVQVDLGKEKKEILSLIDKASKKVQEVQVPRVEVKTEKVDTVKMSKELAKEFLDKAKVQKDDLDELFGQFAQFLIETNRKQNEKDREAMRNEERESLVKEFKGLIK